MSPTKIVFACVLLVFIAVCNLAAKTPVVLSRWQDAPLKIDGDGSDWQTPIFTTEKDVQVDYTFSNDDTNLYVLFVFKDQKYLSSIAQTGLTFWFNTEGKTKKTLGVRFRKKMIAATVVVAIMEKKNGPLPADKKNEIMSKPEYAIIQFMAINKDEDDLTVSYFKDLPEPELQVKMAPGRLAYEFLFPIGANSKLGLAAGKKVMVGFDWGGTTKEMRQSMDVNGGYEPADNRTYPDSPDYDPDSIQTLGGGGQLNRRRGPKRYDFWCELSLAVGK